MLMVHPGPRCAIGEGYIYVCITTIHIAVVVSRCGCARADGCARSAGAHEVH